jgi:hypothetical protein
MYHYNFATLVNEKQKEIERKSNEAWRFAGFEKNSFFSRITRKMYSKKSNQKTNEVCNVC